MEWYYILLICLGVLLVLFGLSCITPLYRHFFKRFWDFTLSLLAIIILLPFFIIFTPINAIAMKGNPFFVQKRPGKNCKIFKLIKYRTMTNKKDKNGDLLPDDQRLTKYGKILRSTSLDELPELFNILIGEMSIVGPRPQLIKDMIFFDKKIIHRQDIVPGLTGLAQINGRNNISWEERFDYDLNYVVRRKFLLDIKIIFLTVYIVLKKENISSLGMETSEDYGNYLVRMHILNINEYEYILKHYKEY